MRPEDLSFIVRVQTTVSAALALLVVLGVVIPTIVSLMNNGPINIPPVFQDWGGVIIGFYFGTFLTQLSGLMKPRDPIPPAPAPGP